MTIEKLRLCKQRWRKNNREKIRRYQALWRKQNSQMIKEYSIAWKHKNAKKIKEASATWRKKNHEKRKLLAAVWRAKNRDKLREKARRRNREKPAIKLAWNLAQYGLTIESHAELMKQQNGLCAVCGKQPGKKRFAIDHDHRSGKNRGLLCTSCNTGLGLFLDNPMLLREAANYLEKHQ